MNLSVPKMIEWILTTLHDAGYEAFLVGGCVRDLWLGRTPKDFDVVTSAMPDTIESLFPKTLPIGKAFGIIQVLNEDGTSVDVATYRTDSPESDGRRPVSIGPATAKEDAVRRDFTINALLWDSRLHQVIDYTGAGISDLKQKWIRAIGEPSRRFAEDALRMLRAVRFSGTLDFQIEPATMQAIQGAAKDIHRISAERIQQELSRILTESIHVGDSLQCLQDSGLLAEILPEISAMQGVEQPPEFHPEGDVFAHTKIMLNHLPSHPSLTLALAMLFHDVGKPPTANLVTLPDGSPRWRFERHATLGEEMTREILRRLKYSTHIVETVAHMVGNHMRLADAPNMRESKLRQLIGSPTFIEELELHRLDCISSHSILTAYHFLRERQEAFLNEPVLPLPIVTGKTLISRGYAPSPQFKNWLQTAYEHQLEGVTDLDVLLSILPPPPESSNLPHSGTSKNTD